jgi:hypothetical protein
MSTLHFFFWYEMESHKSTTLEMTTSMVPVIGSCRLPFVKLAFARNPQGDDRIHFFQRHLMAHFDKGGKPGF